MSETMEIYEVSLSENRNNTLRSHKPILNERGGLMLQSPFRCKQNVQDIFYIFIFYIFFYAFLLLFFVLLLKGAIATDDSNTILWAFLFIGVLFSIIVGGAISVGTKHVIKEKAKMREEKKRKFENMNAV